MAAALKYLDQISAIAPAYPPAAELREKIRRVSGGQAPERSLLRSGLAMGFALVAGTALLLLALFFWTLKAAS